MISRLMARLRRSEALILDARAATELARLELPFLPWTSSSLRPAAMLQLLNEIVINRRLRVVELGAGVSTIAFAKVLRPLGGQLISVEDDLEWATNIRSLLIQHGLADVVRLVHAPLVTAAELPNRLEWFAVSPIISALGVDKIDLLLVDGPKAFDEKRAMARLPAWKVLGSSMARHSAIALDDVERKGERKVLENWRADGSFDFKVAIQSSGIALCTRGVTYNSAI